VIRMKWQRKSDTRCERAPASRLSAASMASNIVHKAPPGFEDCTYHIRFVLRASLASGVDLRPPFLPPEARWPPRVQPETPESPLTEFEVPELMFCGDSIACSAIHFVARRAPCTGTSWQRCPISDLLKSRRRALAHPGQCGVSQVEVAAALGMDRATMMA
jgi:hypothetical protein